MHLIKCIAVGLILLFLPLYLRVVWEARTELNLAQHHLRDSKKIEEAVDHYRKAIAWNAPGNWYSKQALLELSQLALEKLEGTQKLEALRQLIRGIQSGRNFTQTWLYPERITTLNLARQEIEKVVPDSEKLPRVENLHKPNVNYGYQILAQICFLLWISLTVLAIYNGMTREGKIIGMALAKRMAISLVFFGLWLVCLRFA